MNVNFYEFKKRENSTAQPGASVPYQTFDCKLKDDTSIIHPIIELAKPVNLNWSTVLGFNYCYISDFSRYYFVRDIVFKSNVIVEISLDVDPLASFKSQISAASEYVLRSASDYDGDIVDNLYPTKGNTDILMGGISGASEHFDSANKTYVLGVINNNSSYKFGAVQYYAMTSGEIGDMMSYLLGVPDENSGIGQLIATVLAPLSNPDLQQSVSRSILDPAQYIVESFALPYAPPIASSGQTVKANWFSVGGATGDIISNTSTDFFLFSGGLDIPDHPQKNDRGPYTNLEPYMKYWLYLGPFGLYPLDSLTVYTTRRVTYTVSGDLMGNITMKLYVDGKLIDVLHANVKCNFPVAQVSMDVSRAAQAGLSTAASALRVTTGDAVNGIASGASGIMSAADAMLPKVRSISSQGTFVNVYDLFYAYAEAHWIVDDDNTHRGRPLCQQKTIGNLSGYILVSDPDIAISGTAEENTMIKNYMANGFFYE